MRNLFKLLIFLSVLLNCCKQEDDIQIDTNSTFLVAELGNVNFQSTEAIHDPENKLIFFYDNYYKSGVSHNYSTKKTVIKKNFTINEDGYADIGFSYNGNQPELFIPSGKNINIVNMHDLETIFTLHSGITVSALSASNNIISVGYCDYSTSFISRYGSFVDKGNDRACDNIESAMYNDTLRTLVISGGSQYFNLYNQRDNGLIINSTPIRSDFMTFRFIRSTVNGGYLITSTEGHIYNFAGKYIGKLPVDGNNILDYAISVNGEFIYAVDLNQNIEKFSYPSLTKIGQTFPRREDIRYSLARVFADDENLIMIYNLASKPYKTEIRALITPLGEIGN